ncbi:MAG: GNAT family N-acetyltransferase [Gammaproteobacteria bacterium]|nr:GNAT family N-acetyltransferase [Gammaproteobacteria bacterium]
MKDSSGPLIRPAAIDHAPAINDIANWYIEHTATNFDTQPWKLDKRIQWAGSFNRANCPYHLLAAEIEGEIAGFAYNASFRPKNAYSRSTETTVYVKQGLTGRGIGEALYHELFDRIQLTDLHRAFAIITLPNPASVRLHEKLGFAQCGLLSEAGWKFNAYHSIAMYEMEIMKNHGAAIPTPIYNPPSTPLEPRP